MASMRGALAAVLQDALIETAYLHGADHPVAEGLQTLKDRDAETIVCVPAMLFAGGEVKSALTAAVQAFMAGAGDVTVLTAKDPAIDPKMLRAAKQRLDPVLKSDAVTETMLVVVGPGGMDDDANADVAKVARMIWEGAGVGWTEVCYATHARPTVAESLAHGVRLGFKHVVVLPYLLVEDDRIAEIDQAVAAASADNTDVTYVRAAALGIGELLAQTLADRVRLAVEGGAGNAMNCQLCTYREQVLGADHDHHHHAHEHDHGHGHSHGHDHVHPHDKSHVHPHDHD